jgi:predicted protein tyrosine phosphatase
MQSIHVCALSRVEETVNLTGARTLITLMHRPNGVPRPAAIAPERHLTLQVSDITEALDGHVLPGEAHVATLVEFFRGWDRQAPIVVHCYAGVSRSTAAAFIGACVLAPERDEVEIATALRAASPTATPNSLLVEHADRLLGRNGRMVEAIRLIGRGTECLEGVPFAVELG